GPYRTVRPSPAPSDMARLRELLAQSQRPFVLLGGGGWSAKAVADMRAFVEANDLPVGCAFRFQDLFDNRHPNYAGDVGIGINPALARRVKESDLLIVVGARLGEMTTSGYTLVRLPVPEQALVHVHAGAEELGRVYQAALPINAGMAAFAAAARAMQPVDPTAWKQCREQARADYLANIRVPQVPGAVQIGEIMEWLNA